MKYQGRELVELKYDTMQHWPEGRELLIEMYVGELTSMMIYSCYPKSPYPWKSETDGYKKAYELPTATKRRVTRAECAGMAVKDRYGNWEFPYHGTGADQWWGDPMNEYFADRALTLADALAGRTLGMEVEG